MLGNVTDALVERTRRRVGGPAPGERRGRAVRCEEQARAQGGFAPSSVTQRCRADVAAALRTRGAMLVERALEEGGSGRGSCRRRERRLAGRRAPSRSCGRPARPTAISSDSPFTPCSPASAIRTSSPSLSCRSPRLPAGCLHEADPDAPRMAGSTSACLLREIPSAAAPFVGQQQHAPFYGTFEADALDDPVLHRPCSNLCHHLLVGTSSHDRNTGRRPAAQPPRAGRPSRPPHRRTPTSPSPTRPSPRSAMPLGLS